MFFASTFYLYENLFETIIGNTALQVPYEDDFSQEPLFAFEDDFS